MTFKQAFKSGYRFIYHNHPKDVWYKKYDKNHVISSIGTIYSIHDFNSLYNLKYELHPEDVYNNKLLNELE